jgi:hypothetical protein
MTLIGPPPRAPGETPGLACRTGQRRRLSVAPFLKALPWLRVEYQMQLVEVDDASPSSVPHRGWMYGALHLPTRALQRHFYTSSAEALPLTCRLLGIMGVSYVGLGSHGDETFPEASCNGGVSALLP